MGYTNFNMRLDNDLRGRAYPVLEQYGLTPSQAVRMFFNQIANTGKVPLSFDWASEPMEVSDQVLQVIQHNQLEQSQGKSTQYANLDEMMTDLAK